MKTIDVKNLDIPDEVFDRGVRILLDIVLREEKERKKLKLHIYREKRKLRRCLEPKGFRMVDDMIPAHISGRRLTVLHDPKETISQEFIDIGVYTSINPEGSSGIQY